MTEERRLFQITNELGMHVRAAAAFVQLANRYRAEVEIEKDGKRVNGKSLLGVLMLAAAKNEEITLIVRGEDAPEAIRALGALIQANFNLGA